MMTKTLLLLRHAKSSWKDQGLDDHERPLNSRGREAASRMGKLLQSKNFQIDLVLSSTSARTRETAQLVFAEFPIAPTILFQDALYHATPDEIANTLKSVANEKHCVLILGHNPGLEEFITMLAGELILLPTASLAQLELQRNDWELSGHERAGRLVQVWRPRELDAD